MMCRTAYFVVFVIALGAIGCGSDERQQDETTKATAAAVSPEVVQQKPSPVPAPVATASAEQPATPVPAAMAKSNSKPASTSKVHHVVAEPTAQCAPGESRACELANGILNVTPAERVAWAKQEFAKREINDVHDDQ
jgi:hypothetical protein